jgi:2-keto-4-pentenoate hydratase/2-oxohepta-3-ene-1,7-dioic acid hydratase in catechol pathway
MRLATFAAHDGRPSIGLVIDERIVEVGRIAPELPRDMNEFLALGHAAIARIAERAKEEAGTPVDAVRLLPPVPRPRKFLGLGGNYASHVAEAKKRGFDRSSHQTWFNKQVTCVAGPFDDVHLPRVSASLDYEGELAVVIGARCRHVSVADAPSVIAGYTICNDVSVREWQLRAPTMMLGKSFDTHGPIGPWIVTPDEVGDPHALRLRTWVNEELRQDASTKEMIFDCYEMIAELTTAFTLEPGDILATGTPAGVGGLMVPPRYLRAGDVVRIAIERIGELRNRVVPEPHQQGGIS